MRNIFCWYDASSPLERCRPTEEDGTSYQTRDHERGSKKREIENKEMRDKEPHPEGVA